MIYKVLIGDDIFGEDPYAALISLENVTQEELECLTAIIERQENTPEIAVIPRTEG